MGEVFSLGRSESMRINSAFLRNSRLEMFSSVVDSGRKRMCRPLMCSRTL